jgi:hypothetical protein
MRALHSVSASEAVLDCASSLTLIAMTERRVPYAVRREGPHCRCGTRFPYPLARIGQNNGTAA